MHSFALRFCSLLLVRASRCMTLTSIISHSEQSYSFESPARLDSGATYNWSLEGETVPITFILSRRTKQYLSLVYDVDSYSVSSRYSFHWKHNLRRQRIAPQFISPPRPAVRRYLCVEHSRYAQAFSFGFPTSSISNGAISQAAEDT